MTSIHPLIGQPINLHGRVVLVTGATGLVGRGIAEALLGTGAFVVVSSRSPDRLHRLQHRFRHSSDKLLALVANIGEPQDTARVLHAVRERLGAIDAVIDAMGPPAYLQPLSLTPPSVWDQAVEVGLTARYVVARTFLPELIVRPGTSYTLMAAYSGVRPDPEAGPHSVTMAGALMMQRTLAQEYAGHGVRLNAVVLGPILPSSHDELSSDGPSTNGHQVTSFPARPRELWLSAADIGAFVAFITSEAGAVISGETIEILDRNQLRAWMGT